MTLRCAARADLESSKGIICFLHFLHGHCGAATGRLDAKLGNWSLDTVSCLGAKIQALPRLSYGFPGNPSNKAIGSLRPSLQADKCFFPRLTYGSSHELLRGRALLQAVITRVFTHYTMVHKKELRLQFSSDTDVIH